MEKRIISEIKRSREMMGIITESKEKKDNEPYVKNIDKDTVDNKNYRKVVFTGKHLQLVLMSLQPGEEIGMETHQTGDQFIRIEEGNGELIIEKKTYKISDDFGFTIPAGKKHNIKNTGDKLLKLYSVYGPPEHESGLIQKTKPKE